MSGFQFVAPAADTSSAERLHTMAIQATAVMLQSWFEDEGPSPEKARQMVTAVMEALLRTRPEEQSSS